jgi:hypothetical protein
MAESGNYLQHWLMQYFSSLALWWMQSSPQKAPIEAEAPSGLTFDLNPPIDSFLLSSPVWQYIFIYIFGLWSRVADVFLPPVVGFRGGTGAVTAAVCDLAFIPSRTSAAADNNGSSVTTPWGWDIATVAASGVSGFDRRIGLSLDVTSTAVCLLFRDDAFIVFALAFVPISPILSFVAVAQVSKQAKFFQPAKKRPLFPQFPDWHLTSLKGQKEIRFLGP